jgi:N utilization substance protein B
MTDRALVAKWPIDRIDPVLRALFRAAGAELTRWTRRPRWRSPNMSMSPRPSSPTARSRNSSTPSFDHMAREAKPARGRPVAVLMACPALAVCLTCDG